MSVTARQDGRTERRTSSCLAVYQRGSSEVVQKEKPAVLGGLCRPSVFRDLRRQWQGRKVLRAAESVCTNFDYVCDIGTLYKVPIKSTSFRLLHLIFENTG